MSAPVSTHLREAAAVFGRPAGRGGGGAEHPASVLGHVRADQAASILTHPRDGSGFSQTISIGGPASVTPPAAAGNVGDAGAGTEGSAAVSAGPSRYQKRRAVPSWVTSHRQSWRKRNCAVWREWGHIRIPRDREGLIGGQRCQVWQMKEGEGDGDGEGEGEGEGEGNEICKNLRGRSGRKNATSF